MPTFVDCGDKWIEKGEPKMMTKTEFKAMQDEINADEDKWNAQWQEGYDAGINAWHWGHFFVHGCMWVAIIGLITVIALFSYTTFTDFIKSEVRKQQVGITQSSTCITDSSGLQTCQGTEPNFTTPSSHCTLYVNEIKCE